VPTLPWLAAQAVSGQEALFRYLAGGRLLVERSLGMLESQFRFLKDLDFHAEMSRKMADFGGTYVKEHLADFLLGTAAWLPALLLAPFLAFFFLRDGRRFLKYLAEAVPNAYFERTLYMIDRVDGTAKAYFQGLLKLTMIDTVCLALGLAAIGMPGAFALGLMAAVLAWVPFVGSVIGCVVVVLVAATDFPSSPWVVYAAIGLFLFVRLLDDFVFMPLTVGRSLHMHPLPTVLLIFLGGAVAGIPGLILVLPLAGVVMVVAGTIGGIVNDPRLGARHAFAKRLWARRITADLQS
jgi:predicted PurR-regulated permease PerM